MIVIGIDPGASGAIAILAPDCSDVWVCDMPRVMVSASGGKKRSRINGPELVGIIVDAISLTDDGDLVAYIEQVRPRALAGIPGETFGAPRRSVLTEWQLCAFFERVIGILNGLHVRVVEVDVRTWRAGVGIKAKGRDECKEEARLVAMNQWPSATDKFLKSKDGRAEAALIARYGWLAEGNGGGIATRTTKRRMA